MKNFSLCILSFLLFSPVLSQKDTGKMKIAKFDTSFVKIFDRYVALENALGRNGVNVLIGEVGNNRARYAINQKVLLSYKINWRYINFSFGLIVPALNRNDDKFGRTSGFNFNFNALFKRKVFLDIFFLDQKSLYVANAPELIDGFDKGGPYPVFPEMHVDLLGLDASYIFNNKHFAFKAALNSNERQLKSAGSMFLGGYLFYSRISNKNGILTDQLTPKFNELQNAKIVNSLNLGFSFGYGYNFVIKKYGLISTTGSIGFGPALSEIRYGDNTAANKVVLSGRYKMRLVGAYMGDNISAGVRMLFAILPNSANNNIRIYYENDYISFFFGYRFLPAITKKKMEKKKGNLY